MRNIFLEKTTEYITITMAGAPATTQPDCTVNYEEKTGRIESTATRENKSKSYVLTGTTPVTIVPAPTGAKIAITVNNIIVENKDTASVRFYVKMVDEGGTRTLYDVTLRPKYTWDLDGVKDDSGAEVITHELDPNTTTADIDPSTDRNYVTDAQQTVIENTSGTNTGDQVIPASTSATANQFFESYSRVNGTFGKRQPIWADIDRTTSSIADITTKSHTTLTDIGTNTHAQIDTALLGLVSTSGVNTGDQDLSGYVPTTRTVNDAALSGNITLTTANIEGSTNRRYVQDADLTVISNTSNTNTGDQDLTVLIPKSIGTGKGVLIGFSADGTPVTIASASANGMFLVSDDNEASGIKWVVYP